MNRRHDREWSHVSRAFHRSHEVILSKNFLTADTVSGKIPFNYLWSCVFRNQQIGCRLDAGFPFDCPPCRRWSFLWPLACTCSHPSRAWPMPERKEWKRKELRDAFFNLLFQILKLLFLLEIPSPTFLNYFSVQAFDCNWVDRSVTANNL